MVDTNFSILARAIPSSQVRWFQNPGACYNLGNCLALLAAVLNCVMHAKLNALASVQEIQLYFVGTWPAIFITVAVGAFLFGGRQYAVAWENGYPPLERENQKGHLISAFGALLIGFGLIGFSTSASTFILAVLTTALHVGGKLGSWWHDDKIQLYKLLPLMSRSTYAS
jgi:hypothetical protein